MEQPSARGDPAMCFSATASFSLAAATAAIGLATVRQVRHPRELPVAMVPWLFAAQQAVEGVLWLRLSGNADAGGIAGLSLVFLLFAQILWPVFSPLAVLLIEPGRRRRRVLYAVAMSGAVLSVYLLVGLLAEPPLAAIRNHSIAYSGDPAPWSLWQMPYLVCTGAPLLLSSHGAIRIFGAVVLAGFLVSAYAYAATYVSVWCFFAAAASAILYLHFRQAAGRAGPGRCRPCPGRAGSCSSRVFWRLVPISRSDRTSRPAP